MRLYQEDLCCSCELYWRWKDIRDHPQWAKPNLNIKLGDDSLLAGPLVLNQLKLPELHCLICTSCNDPPLQEWNTHIHEYTRFESFSISQFNPISILGSQFNSKSILDSKWFLSQNHFLIHYIGGLISESTSVCFGWQSHNLCHETGVKCYMLLYCKHTKTNLRTKVTFIHAKLAQIKTWQKSFFNY